MSSDQNENQLRQQSADPGFLPVAAADVRAAEEKADWSRDLLHREEAALESAREAGQDTSALAQRVESARMDLEVAEAFQDALEG